MDKIVIDIETKNTFADVGGQANLKDLEVSLIGVYSYRQDRFLAFTDKELDDAARFLQNAGLLIGFSINRFDIPVLAKYFSFDIAALPTIDILEELEISMGRRIGLDLLAKTNLGVGKTHHSLEATQLYRDGDIEELKNYCLNDVKITKELYELAERQGHLLVPERTTGQLANVPLNWKEKLLDVNLMQSLW
ncbi:MAG: ribonuclease H-like domain-containing protein [Parcubacteria group bacterium]|nr:ribonuclease H-like domain-containing protein [Parcubacteria group bacterium]